MKFQKHLSSVEQTFQYAPLTHTCIPYKKWKKVIKYHTYPWSLEDLEQQCQQVEHTFHTSMKMVQRRPRKIPLTCLGCCVRHPSFYRVAPSLTPHELIAFAEINAQAVYKVCKKLEKTKEISGAMKFLESLRSSHKYSFMGSHRVTHLRLSDPNDPIDRTCPICFEAFDATVPRETIAPSQIAIVLPCGHYQCFECFGRMTAYHRIPATFHNRMQFIARSFRCPMCRMSAGEELVNQISFWPLPPEDTKKSFLAPQINL